MNHGISTAVPLCIERNLGITAKDRAVIGIIAKPMYMKMKLTGNQRETNEKNAAIRGVEPLMKILRKAMTFPNISLGITAISLAFSGTLIRGSRFPRVNDKSTSITGLLLIPIPSRIGEKRRIKNEILFPFEPLEGHSFVTNEPDIPPKDIATTNKV